jgi:DNA repair protein RadC
MTMPRAPRDSRSTPELLARVMGLHGPGGLRVARELLARSEGSLGRLDAACLRGTGVGRAARDRLVAALELGRRAATEPLDEAPRLRGPEDVVRLMSPRLRGLAHEEFHVVVLNTRHRVLAVRKVSQGILDASLVHPREVFAPALEARASAVILVHNHPSGDAAPSPEDHRVTQQMTEAGDILGIRVLDHVVMGDPGWSTIPPRPP